MLSKNHTKKTWSLLETCSFGIEDLKCALEDSVTWTMTNSLVIEVFARVLFSFTRGVTEHYDPDEPEVETFGCNDSLSSGGSRVELSAR